MIRRQLARLLVAGLTATLLMPAADGATLGASTLGGDAGAASIELTPATLPATAARRPNIVVFYLDDVGPHDGRLWHDPSLTPAIYDHFVAHGIEFSDAIGETPLCCPGRAQLLTGLHAYNTGVIMNDARMFNPRETIAGELGNLGYATMWAGKYFNHDASLTGSQWRTHGSQWTYLDAILGGDAFSFTDYSLHTKTGTMTLTGYHSTRMAAERTALHIQATPAGTPVFAVVSIYNLHAPNVPLPGFENDPRWAACAHMPPWSPPNYNEADVSDKPALVQALPLLPDVDGWPMAGYCQEMLGVDWAVQHVTDVLAATGRLENSLLILTADNGIGWGQHRLAQQKSLPYTTPVPLLMAWPARWGSQPRQIGETVANVDLAPTLCAVAGCTLGPYPVGQAHPDGVNLLPLLDGTATDVGRDALLESNWLEGRTWTGLRTTPGNPHGRWHYVEWATGERELYDLTADPWELDNRAGDPGLAAVEAALAARLAELSVANVGYQPDASIALGPGTWAQYKGDTVYSATVLRAQTLRQLRVRPGVASDFHVRITNDGGLADSFAVAASTAGNATGEVALHVGAVSGPSLNPTFELADLAAHSNFELYVSITLASGVPRGARLKVVVTIRSLTDPGRVDVVRLVAIR